MLHITSLNFKNPKNLHLINGKVIKPLVHFHIFLFPISFKDFPYLYKYCNCTYFRDRWLSKLFSSICVESFHILNVTYACSRVFIFANNYWSWICKDTAKICTITPLFHVIFITILQLSPNLFVKYWLH